MKRKGFTLIELLAVIIILAIIAVIAVPTIMNIITKARKSAFKDSVYGIIKSGELYYSQSLLNNGLENDVEIVFPSIGELQIKGDMPVSGNMIISKNGDIAIAASNGKYCVRKGYQDTDVTIDEDINTCKTTEMANATMIENITVDNEDIIIKQEQSIVVNATIEPTTATNQKLEWISNNPLVATVTNEGKVTGISIGSTEVIVRSTDGSGVSKTINVKVKSKIYQEEILNGTYPVLGNDLIPVTIANDGTVTKADINEEWYNYENKEWANAVIINDSYNELNKNNKVFGATKKDGYVSFDGTDDYIDLGLENYNFGNKVTFALRFKAYQKEGKTQALLGNWEGSGGGLSINAGNYPYIGLFQQNVNNYVSAVSSKQIEYGKETILVGTYDGTTIKLYMNGELVGSIASTDTIKVNNLPFLLGANPAPTGYNNSEPSNIDVYESAIFNRALTETEIKENYNGKFYIKDSKGLLSYKNFTNETYQENEKIPEENIESYFVWVPKYSYQLFDMGNYTTYIEGKPTTSNAKTINIRFGLNNTNDTNTNECTTPMTSGASGNCKVGDYMTHPAFISMNTNGLWVGKFETTGTMDSITIKPNVASLSKQNIATMFNLAYNYKRNSDSHMMKNTEWGAVAYLSHSKYGINKEININNNSSYLTGYSAVEGTDQSSYPGTSGTDASVTRPYNTPTGYQASSTGNILGIYDLSGGSWEYTTGYIDGIITGGFTQTMLSNYDQKYFDLYLNPSTVTSYNNRILGDAIGEMGPFYYYADNDKVVRYHNSWYADDSHFLGSYAWLGRGGAYECGVLASQFDFRGLSGGVADYISFRIVLSIK